MPNNDGIVRGRERDGVPRGSARAFTLIEVLVVIGIIAVLIGILIPVLSQARRQSNQTRCSANMRQTVTALLAYTQAHDNDFPDLASTGAGHKQWDWIYWQEVPPPGLDIDQSAIAPYVSTHGNALKALFRCPTDDVMDQSHHPILNSSQGAFRYSYSLNDSVKTAGTALTVVNPSHKILLVEEKKPDDGHWITSAGAVTGSDALTDRHSGKANIGYFDGHVGVLSSEELVGGSVASPDAGVFSSYADPKAP